MSVQHAGLCLSLLDHHRWLSQAGTPAALLPPPRPLFTVPWAPTLGGGDPSPSFTVCPRLNLSQVRLSPLSYHRPVTGPVHSDSPPLHSPSRYHSHPVFEPCPSRKDMDNQRNYQALTRDTSTSSTGHYHPGGSIGGCCDSNAISGSSSLALEPFVGFILSPFDPALPLPHTNMKGFVVQQMGTASNALVPYNIRWVVGARGGGLALAASHHIGYCVKLKDMLTCATEGDC